MEPKKNRLFKLVLLPIVFSVCTTFFASCVTVQYNEAGDGDAPTVVEEVEEVEEVEDDEDDD